MIALKAETRQSNLYISLATRTRVFRGGEPLPAKRTLYQMEDYIQQVLAFDVRRVCSPHTADLDAGLPARGLNGEARSAGRLAGLGRRLRPHDVVAGSVEPRRVVGAQPGRSSGRFAARWPCSRPVDWPTSMRYPSGSRM